MSKAVTIILTDVEQRDFEELMKKENMSERELFFFALTTAKWFSFQKEHGSKVIVKDKKGDTHKVTMKKYEHIVEPEIPSNVIQKPDAFSRSSKKRSFSL